MAERVLVIEDEAPLRSMLRQILEREGYQVLDAPDGACGLDLYRENQVDLVITDIFMPNKEGIETIRELKKLDPEAKIVAISGGARTGELDFLPMAEELGAQRTLAKPFERVELVGAVRELLFSSPPRPSS